jgi:hypothetical protein
VQRVALFDNWRSPQKTLASPGAASHPASASDRALAN